MTTTISALFDSYETASQAVRDLEAGGIAHTDTSIVASNEATAIEPATDIDDEDAATGAETGATVGAILGGGAGLLAGLGMLAIPGLGPVVAAGWLASAAVGAVTVGAAGGIVGALTDAGVSEPEAHVYAEGVRRGGTLVVAKVDDTHASFVRSVMARHNAVDPGERDAAYRAQGWTGFQPGAGAHDTTDVVRSADRSANPPI